jgi:uncharacterized SAM-binding protein YcdF (DUF218 family)
MRAARARMFGRTTQSPKRRTLGVLGSVLGFTLATAFTAGFAAFAGLVWFGFAMPSAPADAAAKTDAIVVLTGGEKRLEAGVELLVRGLAPRLYVTGVNRKVEKAELLKQAGNPPAEIAAKIELGYRAANTRGNAEETATWFNSQGLKSLRLVTANYHMRRSRLYFDRNLPRAAIHDHPVVPEGMSAADWWASGAGISTVAREYVKYLAALVRLPSD